jgi:hypothetical protein
MLDDSVHLKETDINVYEKAFAYLSERYRLNWKSPILLPPPPPSLCLKEGNNSKYTHHLGMMTSEARGQMHQKLDRAETPPLMV